MASQLELMAEAHRRGILPADKVPLFEEAQRRGLVNAKGGRPGWSPEMIKGYEDYNKFQSENNLPKEGSGVLAANSATFGFADELSAGVKAGAGALYDFVQGKEPQFTKRYDEAWGGEQARLDAARENAWGGGIPADIAGGFAMGPGKAVAQGTAIIPTLREAASTSGKVGAGYGGAYGVGADDSGTWQGRAEGGAQGVASGYLLGRAIPNVIAGVGATKRSLIDRPIQNYRARTAQQARQAAGDFRAAGINPETVFPPALVQGGPVAGAADNLAGTIFGGNLRDGARRTIQDVERGVSRELSAAGGRRTAAEAGQEAQDLLRRNLTERTIPSDRIKAMDQAQLQDVSGVAPGPRFDPPPPIIDPVSPQPVRPQTAEDVIRAAEMEIPDGLPLAPPARQPKYPAEEVPSYKIPTIEDVPAPKKELAAFRQLENERKRVQSAHNELIKEHNEIRAWLEELKKVKPYPIKQALEIKAREAEVLSKMDKMEAQVYDMDAHLVRLDANLSRAHQEALAAHARKLRETEDARVAKANADLPRRRAEAERVAKELTEQDARIAREQAEQETSRLRAQARASVQKNADDIAARRTDQMRRDAEAAAKAETARLQKEAEARHAEELANRRARAEQDFEIGRGENSFTTQLDAAYEQVARNAPAIQRNPLGSKSEPGRTRTAQLLDEFAQEARQNMKLKGYKGNVFDDTGAVRGDLLKHLDEALGKEVAGRIREYSSARSRSSFVPSVQGLRDMRTAIGKEIESAKKSRAMGETRTADEAMLARLYDALSQDVQTFLRSAGPDGQLAARQMLMVDGEYKRYMRDLRIPLSKVFGEKVAPEQAIAKLRKATRADGGDAELLRRFFNVVGDKGDKLKAVNSIMSDVLDDGLPGFLERMRGMSDESRRIMFSGDAEDYGKALDSLAKAGGHVERFVKVSNRGNSLRQTVSNPGNILAVVSGVVNLPTALTGALGATAASRMLSKPAMAKWLQKAPRMTLTRNHWRTHVIYLRTMAQEQFGATEAAGEQLQEMLLGGSNGKSDPVKIPAVHPTHKTRNDVIEQLQYEAE